MYHSYDIKTSLLKNNTIMLIDVFFMRFIGIANSQLNFCTRLSNDGYFGTDVCGLLLYRHIVFRSMPVSFLSHIECGDNSVDVR